MKQIRLNLHGQPCSLGKRHTVAAAFRATNHGTDVAERSRKTDRAVAPVPFRAPYSRIGNLMAELPYSFIYELRSTPAAPKPYLTGLRRPSAERTTTQICESPASCGSTEPTRGQKSRSGRLIPTNAHPSPGRRKKPRPERQHIESPSAIRTGAPKAMIRRLTMAKLIYATPSSLDGYIVDETGNPDWAAPDEEGFAFITALIRPIGTY